MKIRILVKTNSREKKVEKIDKSSYKISVKSPPVEGKANKEVEEVMAKYFACPKSEAFIISGFKSKRKILQIPG